MRIEELVGNLLNEAAFNTRFEKDLKWELKHGVFVAHGHIDDVTYQLTIEPNLFNVNSTQYTYLNLGFARMTEDGPTEKIISSDQDPSRALGAIKNAIADKIKQLDNQFDNLDAIVMIVVSGEERRTPLYNRLLTSKINGFAEWTSQRANIKTAQGTAIVGMKRALSTEEFQALKHDLQSRSKTVT